MTLFMIFWSGAGILVPVIVIGTMFVAGVLGPSKGPGADTTMLAAGYVAGLITYGIGAYFNAPVPVAYRENEDGSREVVMERNNAHTLYFIPFHYWGWVVAVFATLGAGDRILLRVIGLGAMIGLTYYLHHELATGDEAALERRRERRRRSAGPDSPRKRIRGSMARSRRARERRAEDEDLLAPQDDDV